MTNILMFPTARADLQLAWMRARVALWAVKNGYSEVSVGRAQKLLNDYQTLAGLLAISRSIQ